ncbi:hypothetical protein Ppb6_03836 [Photorhabdus australis subsp. thailandensis]|uniref:Uncharacterized protein n=1 Tax=Photorhabdus australis subsp. thailandensis TaxID=2805096 RepID=A0A1C0TYJ1_9GAMM|nr:hypothetical protein [Photorhabdus australis]OCQ50740.1 hypothetical protein Ppb6_03836 [Photorhabdus australis subsp. thailandensis]
MQHISLSFAGEFISIHGNKEICDNVQNCLLPAFQIHDSTDVLKILCHFELNAVDNLHSVIHELNIELDYSKPHRLPPILMTDEVLGEGMRILKYDGQTTKILCEKTPEQDEILIDISQQGTNWKITYERNNMLVIRAIARMIKYVVGCVLFKKGCLFFHASGINYHGQNYIFYGVKGAGKTSTMFKSCFHLGASFLSDDIIVGWLDGDELKFSGWPKRVGLNLSAISHDHLRSLDINSNRSQDISLDEIYRYAGQHLPPDERKRLEFDTKEFINIFNLKYQGDRKNAIFINLKFTTSNIFSIAEQNLKHRELFMEEKNIKYFTDYLSITPKITQDIREKVKMKLDKLPSYGCCYSYNDTENFDLFFNKIIKSCNNRQ